MAKPSQLDVSQRFCTMKVPNPRWILALLALLSPALVLLLAGVLSRCPRAIVSTLESMVGPAFVGAVLVAAIVPPVIVMTSRLRLYGRLGLVVGFWCGLFLEVYLAFGWASGGSH